MCLTIHNATSLHLFSACILDVTSTVMTRMHVRSSMCAHSQLSGSSVNESCAQDTEQKHGKHGSGAPFLCFPSSLSSSSSFSCSSPCSTMWVMSTLRTLANEDLDTLAENDPLTKVMDITPRLPGRAGQAAYAVSA